MVSGRHASPGIPAGRLILGTEILSSTALESVERGLSSPTRAPLAICEACVGSVSFTCDPGSCRAQSNICGTPFLFSQTQTAIVATLKARATANSFQICGLTLTMLVFSRL